MKKPTKPILFSNREILTHYTLFRVLCYVRVPVRTSHFPCKVFLRDLSHNIFQ